MLHKMPTKPWPSHLNSNLRILQYAFKVSQYSYDVFVLHNCVCVRVCTEGNIRQRASHRRQEDRPAQPGVDRGQVWEQDRWHAWHVWGPQGSPPPHAGHWPHIHDLELDPWEWPWRWWLLTPAWCCGWRGVCMLLLLPDTHNTSDKSTHPRT